MLSMNAVMCFEIRSVDFAGVKSVSTAIITIISRVAFSDIVMESDVPKENRSDCVLLFLILAFLFL